MKKPEVLAPAGDFQSLKSAIFAGADAVYFGAKSFNARAKASNFGDDIKDAVSFAHLYGARVYLTLNTLIENDDAYQLINTIKNALDAGVDAFIVQDFGVVNLINNCFKNVEVHASTQMAINNYYGALQAQKMGITRVVLSRETSIEDIKLIKQNTNLEIEYFVQGALCVCFSGNCYLSSSMFGKSGNKGECLQPCRLPYKAMLKGKQIAEGYLLSAKDINMSKRLKELADAGVDSFKIEGRLRRPAYVFATTKVYRNIVDNNYLTTTQDQIDLKKAFNRGDYTEGYFNGNANIIDKNIQGHIGIKIGEVASFEQGKRFNVIKIRTNHNIAKGDVIKFSKNNKELATITALDINKSADLYSITTTSKVAIGATAHLICDAQKEQADLSFERKLPLRFNLYAHIGEPIKLEYSLLEEKTFEPRLCGEVVGDVCQEAKSLELTYETAMQSLQKLGGTNFFLHKLVVDTNGVFVGKQQLNTLRQTATKNILESFNLHAITNYQNNYVNEQLNKLKTTKNNSKKYSIQIGELFDSNSDFLVVKPSDYANFNYSKIIHKNAFLYIPAFLQNNDLKIINNILNKNQNLGIYAENIGALEFDKKTILGAKLNIKNMFAIEQLISKNVVAIVTSPELTNENYQALKNAFDIPVLDSNFNDFDLMTFVHCPIKTIFGNSCSNCQYQDNIEYIMQNGQKLELKRYKVANCYFTLIKK